MLNIMHDGNIKSSNSNHKDLMAVKRPQSNIKNERDELTLTSSYNWNVHYRWNN